MNVGAYIPLAFSKEGRGATGDPRPSLTERYPSRDAYVGGIRMAARRLEGEGFLLSEDAAIIIQQAASTPLFAQGGFERR